MLVRQEEIEHSQGIVDKPCPFCCSKAELWYKPDPHRIECYQVRCTACGARGPICDCGEESAIPSWESVRKIEEV